MNPIAYLMTAIVAVALGACGNGAKAPLHAQADCADWNTEAFFEAAEVSDVTRCLQAGMDPEARSEWSLTPLHWAAHFGNAEAIEALIAAGANLEARDESGYTPLHLAASTEHTEAIEVLIAAGANLEARSKWGTPLREAAYFGKAETIGALATAGANLEARDESGYTPLHWAAYFGKAETIEALLRAGADPKALTTAGKLPFDLIKDNEQLKRTDGYWKLNQARFE